jgi:APA family basic amino acid/polyamine antiporter
MTTRQLGLGMATALVVGNTIGMGIFMQPAALAPFGLNALSGWAAVILGCVCLALTFAALARKLPQADGPFGYVRSTLGETVAFPALWSYWISCWVTLPVLAIGSVGYFLSVFPAARAVPPAALAVSFMWFFIGVNLLGIKSGGRVQVLTSLLKIVPLVLVLVVGTASILSSPGSYTPNLPATPLTLHASMGAAAVALYVMLGFESAAVAAGRVTNPERTIPRATLIGTLIVATFYVTVVAIGMLVVPQATLAAADAPFVTIVDHLLGAGNGRWISLFVVISGLGCMNGWTLLSGELTRTLASHRLLPGILGESNRFGAPWAALLLAGALASAVGIMNYSATLVGAFTKLSLIVSAANLPLYVCSSFALFYLLSRSPAGLSPALWIAGAGGIAFSAFAFFGVGWEPFIWALALALAGVPIYFWMRRRRPAALESVLRGPAAG